MPGFVYALGPAGEVFVNLYVSNETTVQLNRQALTLSVQSDMPWGGHSKIAVRTDRDVQGALKLRIPGWARNQPAPGGLYAYTDKSLKQATVSVNGRPIIAAPDLRGYVSIDRIWKSGDVVEIDLPMETRRVAADARVKDNKGKLAIERGPIVYAAEWPDVDRGKACDLMIAASSPLTPVTTRELGGGTLVRAEGRNVKRPAEPAKPATLIPYHLWANRGAGEMTVWIPAREYAPGDVGPAGGYIFYVNPNSAADGWRYLEAAPYDQSAGAKWGCFRTLIQGARGTAIGTGRQNTRDILAACSDPGTAAQLCANLKVNGVTGWFLPSRDELAQMYANLKATGVVDFGDRGVSDNFSYWASSQLTADMAAHIDFPDLGRQHFDDKDFPRRVRAIRAF
jgi:hypothetical protein